MRTSRSVIIGIVATVCLIIGCTDGRYDAVLSQIDTLIENHPDSALLRLDSLRSRKDGWSKRLRMRFDLLEAKAQNKAFIPFASDSIAKDFTAYYDSHGTANERMLAHYLLGCAYRDLGEAPQAVDCYLDAISQADTTAQDCDYYTLSAVYAQMACVYYDQLLLSNSIETYKKASHFAFLAKKYDFAILDLERIANNYILMNKKDSAELVLIDVQKLYAQYGYTKESLLSSTKLIYLYIEIPEKLNDAKRLMEKYESEPDFFNDNNELIASKRQFYYYKGRYHEAVNQLDSAEYYYRKVYRTNMSYVDMDPMYRGLLSVFTKRHQADSIAKYAQLYCLANDSSIAKKDRDLTAQMAASYNYSRSQKIAETERQKAQEAYNWLAGIILCLLIGFFCLHSYYRKKKEEMRQMSLALTAAKAEQWNTQNELQKLKSKDYESLIAEKEKKEEELQLTINSLQKKNNISKSVDHFIDFENSNIVKLFHEKASFKVGTKIPTGAEWKMLVTQFSKSMPALFKILGQGKLSPLELNTCILLLLNFPEGTISGLTNTTSQSVSTAKRRANQKLFHAVGAHSLKNNLIQAISHPSD